MCELMVYSREGIEIDTCLPALPFVSNPNFSKYFEIPMLLSQRPASNSVIRQLLRTMSPGALGLAASIVLASASRRSFLQMDVVGVLLACAESSCQLWEPTVLNGEEEQDKERHTCDPQYDNADDGTRR